MATTLGLGSNIYRGLCSWLVHSLLSWLRMHVFLSDLFLSRHKPLFCDCRCYICFISLTLSVSFLACFEVVSNICVSGFVVLYVICACYLTSSLSWIVIVFFFCFFLLVMFSSDSLLAVFKSLFRALLFRMCCNHRVLWDSAWNPLWPLLKDPSGVGQ